MVCFLSEDGILADLRVASKKQLIHSLAERAARVTGIDAKLIGEKLLERERLGQTGVGHGIALPHTQLPGLTSVVGLMARLHRPIDFDANDRVPVDLVFCLLAPEACQNQHLTAFAKVSRMLRDRSFCEKLRGADGQAALFALFCDCRDRRAA